MIEVYPACGGAGFKTANLVGARFDGADLRGARFTGAQKIFAP